MAKTEPTRAQQIDKQINLTLVSKGLRKGSSEFKRLEKRMKEAAKQNNKFIDSFRDLDKVIQGTIKVSQKWQSTLGKVGKAYGVLYGLTMKGVTAANQYNKAIVGASVVMQQFGETHDTVRESTAQLSRQLSITMADLAELKEAYFSTMRFASSAGFESMANRIKEIWGPDPQRQKQIMSDITGLGQKYSKLAATIGNIKGLTEEQVERAQQELDMLRSRNEIEVGMYRRLTAFLSGQSKMTEEERQQMQAITDMKNLANELAVTWGKMILPVLEKITDMVREWTKDGIKFKHVLIAGLAVMTKMAAVQVTAGVVRGIGRGIGGVAARTGGATVAGAVGGKVVAGAAVGISAAAVASVALIAIGILGIGALVWEVQDIWKSGKKRKAAEKVLRTPGAELGTKKSRMLFKMTKEEQAAFGAAEEAARQAKRLAREREAAEVKHTEELTRQVELMEGLNTLTSAQSGFLDAIVQKSILTGKIDDDRFISQQTRLAETVKLQASIADKYADYLDSMKSGEKISRAELAKRVALTKNEYELIKETGDLSTQQLSRDAQRNKLREEAERQEQKLVEASLKHAKSYEGRIKYAQAEVGLMQSMVTLADNLMMGVGASVQMRVNLFQANEKVIESLKRQRQVAMEQLEAGKNVLANRQQVLEIDQKILQTQVAQAQQVRALRDGWVDAISAMNIGAGSFTKIIMTQQQGTAQAVRMGAEISRVSGDIRRGRGDVTSERFTQQGRISGGPRKLYGNQSMQEAYGLRGVIRGEAGAAMQLGNRMQAGAREQIQGAGRGLADLTGVLGSVLSAARPNITNNTFNVGLTPSEEKNFERVGDRLADEFDRAGGKPR